MSIIDYQVDYFFNDLEKIKKSSVHSIERISFVSLIEDMTALEHFGDAKKVFLNFENKEYFLLTYMYYVLFEQAIYELNLKGDLEHRAYSGFEIPNFCGILSSYTSNFSPDILIAIVSTYINKENKEFYLHEFEELTCLMFKKYQSTIESNLGKSIGLNTFSFMCEDIYLSLKDKEKVSLKHSKRKQNYAFYKNCLMGIINTSKSKIAQNNE